jgi:hypothetical protein
MEITMKKHIVHISLVLATLYVAPAIVAFTPGQAGNISQLIADIKAGRVTGDTARARAKEVSLRMAPGSAILNELTDVAETKGISDILDRNPVEEEPVVTSLESESKTARTPKSEPMPKKATPKRSSEEDSDEDSMQNEAEHREKIQEELRELSALTPGTAEYTAACGALGNQRAWINKKMAKLTQQKKEHGMINSAMLRFFEDISKNIERAVVTSTETLNAKLEELQKYHSEHFMKADELEAMSLAATRISEALQRLGQDHIEAERFVQKITESTLFLKSSLEKRQRKKTMQQ